MLKRITVDQLVIGMYVQEFCGSWIDHPFWRSKFLIVEPADLQRVLDGHIKELVIDTDKGLDVAVVEEEVVVEEALEPPPDADAAPVGPKPDSVEFSKEVRRASALCKRSKAAVTSLFAEARLGMALDLEDCLPLVGEISDSVMRNAGAMISVVRMKSRDEYTYMHSVAVCALMIGLARQLDLDAETTREAGLAGLLHDIGKAHMPLPILNKPGKLSTDEFTVIRSHPERGAAMLADLDIAKSARDVCLHHHERMDGTGYPHRLKGEQISVLARMAAICDVYDALTSNRSYKTAWNPGEALRKMASWTGHFDPVIFQAFVKTVGIYPVGALVRLKSGRLAVVVEQNAHALLAPKVRVFYSTKSDERITPVLLDLDPQHTTERIVACESAEDWPFKDLDELSSAPGG
jgi:putative nucleotidyltransferase with HDIG domain